MSIEIKDKRTVIRSVRKAFEKQYENYDPDFKFVTPAKRTRIKTLKEIRRDLAALDLETCSSADVDQALGVGGWGDNRCSECGTDCDYLIQIGEEPDYEAQWVELCVSCLEKALKTLKGRITESLFTGTKR